MKSNNIQNVISNIPFSMRNNNRKSFKEEKIILIKSKSCQYLTPKIYKLETITLFKNSKDDNFRINIEKRKKREERKKNFDEFIKRNYAILERKKGLENRKNYLIEYKREIRSEQERIEGFNRLIDDANRRYEAKERAQQMLNNIKNNGNKKKYSTQEWKKIYDKRFIEFQKISKEKIKIEKQKKEEEIKKENEKIENEIQSKTIKIPNKKINEIFDKLYNKGRKIYNSKKDLNHSQSLKKNSSYSNNKSFNKENRNNSIKKLKKNKSISKYQNIQPRYMQFFQTQSLEETLGKLKEERREYENKNSSNHSTIKEKDKDQSRISYASNNSGLKIYQTNFIQCIKFKDVSSLSDSNNSGKKNNNYQNDMNIKGNDAIFNYTEENKNYKI